MIHEWLDIPLYPVCLHVVVCEPLAQVKEIPVFSAAVIKDTDAALVLYRNEHIAIVLPEQAVSMLDVKTIAHECWHATARILYFCDVRYDVNNPEPFAYLHGFVFTAVLKAIKVRLMHE